MGTEESSDLALFKRLLHRSRVFRPHLVGVLFLDLLATPLALLSPLALKLVIDNVLGSLPLPGFMSVVPGSFVDSPNSILLFAVVLLIGISILTQLHSLDAAFFRTYTGEKMTLDFRAQLFSHGQRLSMAYHDAKGVSHSLYRVQYDATALQRVTLDGLLPMLTSLITVVAMIYVIALINGQLALVALSICPLLIYLIKKYKYPLRKRWRQQKRLDHAAVSVITEVFSSLRVVKAFTQETVEHERYKDRATKSLSAYLQVSLLHSSFGMVTGAVTALGTGAVLLIGVRTIQAGAMTLGDLLVVMFYLGLLYSPLKVMGRKLASMQNAFASAERAFSFLDESSDVPEKPDAKSLDRAKGVIRLENVSFSYQDGTPVLREVSMDAPAGAKVGIAGITGAGKTTLMSLLMRFYDPSSGRILLDGVDIREYKLPNLRRQFGIMLQEPVLFSNSIAENIAYGRPGASDEAIFKAAQAANAHDFIMKLPEGYATLVGERGMRLSGGERQRLALTRAFLRDAPILLLDEPTSSVDLKTEEGIMEALERLMHGRTTIMIAHRLSTLAGCDFLFEVSDGEVIQVAGHTPGIYSNVASSGS